MSTQHTTSGIVVTEFDADDTLDVTLESAATEWERLADVFADGQSCPGCMFYESGRNPFSGSAWRECSCLLPQHCPVINGDAIAAAFRRQAS